MIREQKNKFWLTLILILSLSFSAFALGVANVFNNRKTNPALPVDAATDETLLTDKVGDPTDVNNNGVTDENLWKKNGSTFVSEIGIIYGGTEISVETASDLNTTANDESWHSALRVRVKGTDGTTPYENTYQPYIQNGYELVGFYFYADSTQYGDLFKSGENATTEDIDPSYTGKITIKAVCKPINYNIYLHYSLDGLNWREQEHSFNVENQTTLQGRYEQVSGNVEEFKAWAIKPNLVTPDDTNKTLKVNGTGIVLSYIKPGESESAIEPIYDITGNTILYYKVNKIIGYSNVIDNFKCPQITPTNTFVAVNTFDPKIRATWSYIYNGIVNNSDYSNSIDDTKVGAFGDSIVPNSDNKKANLKFSANITNNNYGFFNNTGFAFETNVDMLKDDGFGASGKYGVYNYGHELTHWTISFGNAPYTNYGPSYNGSNWGYGANPSTSIETLESLKMYDLAESLDIFFISGYDNREINLIPSWQAVDIEVHVNTSELKSGQINTKIAETKYNSNYTISDSQVFVSPGQMIYAYGFSEDEPSIAKNHNADPMPWNYVNIAQNQFDKNGDTYKFEDGTYKLTVEPICVDNVYKISLTGDKALTETNRSYNLLQTETDTNSTNQYKFAVGSSNADAIVDITEANLTNRYDHYKSGSIEKYISEVVSEVLHEYNTKIGNGTLDILRKVFTTNDGATANDLTCTLPTNGTTNFYIYLANNRPVGDLPVFTYGYYDLIAWKNMDGKDEFGNTKNYAYVTEKYNEELHKTELENKNLIIKDLKTNNEDLNVNNWLFLEMNSSMELQAHFYRKNYLLDLNTLREGEEKEGRYGYILIEITEEDPVLKNSADDMGGKFIALYQDDKMQYFAIPDNVISGINVNTITALGVQVYDSTTEGLKHPKDLIIYSNSQCFIKLYAGCTLKITSSCVDYFNGDDLTYVDMVGYYLSSVTTSTTIGDNIPGNRWFDGITYENIQNKTAGKHVVTLVSGNENTQGTIEGAKCPSGSKIAINAYFAPIDYEIKISLKTNGLNNPFAGRVDHNNKSTTYKNATIVFDLNDGNLINVESEWSYSIDYLANAGYTLSENAFTAYEKASVSSHILQYYNSSNTSQSYPFALNSAWLINHYYTTTYDATPNFAQTLAFDVNTELYKFAYNVEFVDELGSVLEVREYLDSIILDGKTDASNIALIKYGSETFDKLSKKLIGKEFEKLNADEDFYVIKIDGKNYVVLESWLPYSSLGNNNYKTIYEFLLKAEHLTEGTNNEIITQSDMNNIFGFGEIVASDDRILTVRIKVSELYTITLKAEKHEKPDPNYGERTTTVENHNIGFGNYTNGGTLTTTDNFDKEVIVYSYKGVENVISSTFDSAAYSGVHYKLAGSASNLEGNTFTLDGTKVENGNIDVFVTYIPKPITTFNVTYRLNGVEDSTIVAKYGSTNIDNKLIKELTKTNGISLYSGEFVNFGYELLTEGYVVSVTLNGTPTNENPIKCQVLGNVYDAGGFFIIVDLISVKQENAVIMYALQDKSQASEGDYFGEMEVFVNTTNVTPAATNGMYIVSVAEGKELSVNISKMAKGYSFVSLNRASTVLKTDLPEDNKLTITSSFDFEENNTYFVVIKKDIIRATLTLEDDVIYKDNYTLTTSGVNTVVSGNTKSVNAYLGKTLEFTKVDKEKEKLDYYYYLDKDGNEHKIEEVNGKLTLKLTTDILEQLGEKVDGVYNINFGLKTIKKHKLTYNIVNEIYAKSHAVKVGNDDYVSGTYMLPTNVNVNVVAKDNIMKADGVTIKEAKYNIKFSGCDIVDAGGNVLTNAEKEVEFTQGIANGFVVLDEDKTLTITIAPKSYDLNNSEHIYNDIESYNTLNPTESADNISSFNFVGDVKYGNMVTVRFNRLKAEKGELAVVRLSGNDSSDLIVHIRGKQIVSVYDETNKIEYIVNVENIKHSAVEDVKIKEVANLKDKLQEFGYNFNINSDYSDIVEISYVVKNIFKIKTEYLCYKTIKPII